MKQIKKTVLFFCIVAIMMLLYWFDVRTIFSLSVFNAHRQAMQLFVDQHYIVSVLLYMAIYFITVACSIPTGGSLTLIGGLLFGVTQTVVYVSFIATAGAVVPFLMTRYLIGNVVEKRYPAQARALNEEIKRYGYSYLLMSRLITVAPFFLVNILAGLTQISTITFIWTTMLGIIPGTALFAFAGEQLKTVSSVHDIFSPGMIIAFVLLGVLAFLPMIYKRLLLRIMPTV
jgi:uncharacterized membrane protein YdjX (TVP38/TMEM64 family)